MITTILKNLKFIKVKINNKLIFKKNQFLLYYLHQFETHFTLKSIKIIYIPLLGSHVHIWVTICQLPNSLKKNSS